MTDYSLRDRVIAITGSTGGLGSALAEALRAKGAKLALFDLNAEAVHLQAAALGGTSVARGWQVDVTSYDSLDAAMRAAAAHFGGIDIVVANAGVEVVAPMATTAPVVFERVIDINLNGVWRTFRAALEHVQERQGHLLAISSMAAFVHSPLQASYTASKAGVWALCDSIRLEVKHLGVTVGSVHPTFFNTPMMDRVHANPAGAKLWGGNRSGFWKMVTLESVVAGIVRGIERRSDMVVLPAQHTLVARAPGLFRRFIEAFGFRQSDVVEAIDAAGSAP